MRFLAFLPLLTASLLACTTDKETTTDSGTDASTADGSTGAPTGGTTGATSGDPPDTSTSSTTDATTASTTDATTASTSAPVDDCAFLVGKTFKSDEELECGLGPNGVELCNWTLSFKADTYSHQYSDIGEQGSYTCEAGQIKAVDGANGPHGGTIDAETGELVWDTIVYHPAP